MLAKDWKPGNRVRCVYQGPWYGKIGTIEDCPGMRVLFDEGPLPNCSWSKYTSFDLIEQIPEGCEP